MGTICIDSPCTEICEDTQILPGRYRADSTEVPLIRIVADGVTLDLTDVELVGSASETTPDRYTGIGILCEGHRNVTIRNGCLRGFKVGIHALWSDGIVIEECDLSSHYRMRLKSTPEREDASDWLWPHHNDENEWMHRYGAGIYLEESKRAVVRRCQGHHSQNGILLDACDACDIYDNDFSFNSGWGLALWRSCDNRIAHNRFDWCVRGYSHGVYARGQDSTGILVFEQCHRNVFAYNSATHGGDGFFLYAGNQTLRETGEGGCNHNLVYGNDFSHAVANGIEATFSEGNAFVRNILDECEHGVWGGYSYETAIVGNQIADCLDAGIAIEHGHDNRIEGNTFERNATGIRLWWSQNDDLLSSAYGQTHVTDSTRTAIRRNWFSGDRLAVDLRCTTDSIIEQNQLRNVEEDFRIAPDCAGILLRKGMELTELSDVAGLPDAQEWLPPDLPGELDAFLPKQTLRGRYRILVDEWGPYDFREPRLWPSPQHAGVQATFHLYGPEGPFRVGSVTPGLRVVPEEGVCPGTLVISAAETGYHPFELQVAIADCVLHAEGSLLSAIWDVRFFHWEEDPRENPDAWQALLIGTPVDTLQVTELRFDWGMGAPTPRVQPDGFGTLATTQIPLPAGEYEIRTVSDDGVRVWVDGTLLIDNWTWHVPTEDVASIRLESGEHRLRIEHFELDGWATLSFKIQRNSEIC